jgi:hypothetical protein
MELLITKGSIVNIEHGLVIEPVRRKPEEDWSPIPES